MALLAGDIVGQGNGAQDPREVTQGRRHYETFYLVQDLRGLNIVVEQFQDVPSDGGKKVLLPHDATTNDDPLGRDGADQARHPESDIARL